jgi:hypothetical protein
LRHRAIHISVFSLLFFMTLFLAFSTPTGAFYEWQGNEAHTELRGMVRGFGIAYKYPDNNIFFQDRSGSDIGGLFRLIMLAQIDKTFSLELNAYQTYISEEMITGNSSLGTPLDVERSAALEWSFSNKKYIHAAIDRFNVRWSKDRIDLILGRQPINLATTFYFSPNDFFAPFSAQSFYRVYKPGVDAVRAEVRLDNLSQLSLISVLGYRQEPDKDTGWSNSPTRSRSSYIGRVSTIFKDFEWVLLGGTVRDMTVIGGSLQGDFLQWLGIRSEGHISYPDDPQRESHTELSVGLEHYWENNLEVRLEYFYHGSGFGAVSDYAYMLADSKGGNVYLGRNYTALGVGYEFTPLLNAQMSLIANLEDSSGLCSFNAVYSLSNEAELALNLGIPFGKKPDGFNIRSEFGLSPYSLNMEVRYYF